MTNQLSVVHQQNVLGQTFKVYGTIEEPLFLAKDVSEWIGHTNLTVMMRAVDEDEKVKISPKQNLGLLTNNNEYWFITENGIYELLMLSRKPIAKQWKKEVKQILKQIRLTGGTVKVDREEEFIENYFPSFSEDVKKMMVLDLHTKNQELKKTIEVQTPKVEKYEDLLLLPNAEFATTNQVAEFYGVSIDTIKMTIEHHRDEIENDGYVVKIGGEVSILLRSFLTFKESTTSFPVKTR